GPGRDHLDPLHPGKPRLHPDLLTDALPRPLHAVDPVRFGLDPSLRAQAPLELGGDLHRRLPPGELEGGPLADADHVALRRIGLSHGLVPRHEGVGARCAGGAEPEEQDPPSGSEPHSPTEPQSRERAGRITVFPTRKATSRGGTAGAASPSPRTNCHGESTSFWSGSTRSRRWT